MIASVTTTILAEGTMTSTSTGEAVQFWILGTLAVISALGVVAAPKAVYSALFLAMTMIILAVFYIVQGALFLGVVQIVVYTGAVMMLFLFVLMLVGVDSSDSLVETLRGQRVSAIVIGVGIRATPYRRPRKCVDLGVHRIHRTRPGQHRRSRRSHLHPLPLGLRTDWRTADHGDTWRNDARASGEDRIHAQPTRTLAATIRVPGQR